MLHGRVLTGNNVYRGFDRGKGKEIFYDGTEARLG